jgi:hypothetical protein
MAHPACYSESDLWRQNEPVLDLCVCFFSNLTLFLLLFSVRKTIFHTRVGKLSATPVAVENPAFGDLIPPFAKF